MYELTHHRYKQGQAHKKVISPEEWELTEVLPKVPKMEASICDTHETSVNFTYQRQNANITSDLACGCVLSSLKVFMTKY